MRRAFVRFWFSLVVVACPVTLQADEPKRNPDLLKLDPNRWVKIHEQKTGEVIFRRQPHGGSCFDSKRGRLVLFGSDTHGRDFTNSPLYFSPVELKWSRAYDDDPRNTYDVTKDGLAVAGKNGDHPWATHSFGSVVYDASRDEMIVPIFDDHLVPGRFTDVYKDLWPMIKRKPTWVYRMDKGAWTALPGEGVNCFPYCAAYDSDRKVVVAVRPDGIHELGGEPREWKRITKNGHFGWHTNCAYDSKQKAVVVFGSNENRDDIAAYFPKSGEYKLMPTAGQRPPKDQHNPMEFHPDLGKTVVLVDRIEGEKKYAETWLYDLGEDAWTQVKDATLPFASGMNYNMEFDPGHGVMLLVTGGDGTPTRVWALRLVHAAEPEVKSIAGVGPAGEITKVHTGFKFTEGPAADSNGNLYFSDIPNNRIHKVDAEGKLSTVLENSEGCNGLMLDARGRLIACQGVAKKLIAIDIETKKIAVLSDACDGKPLGMPNDLVIDRTGGIYFTAPDTSSVFHLPSAGKAVKLLDGLPRPNGILLSPDEKTLIVLPSGSADVLAYPIERPGVVGKAKVLCKLEQNPKQPGRLGGDGLTIDTNGNLYLTKPSLKAIQVVSPEGKMLGLITFPEEPSNCTFGGKDLKTLYVTAQSSLYAVKMEATGHRFGATRSEEPLPEAWDYTTAMRKVAAKFKGNEGVVIHVGGSMTIANPYGTWPRNGKGKTLEDVAILKWMHTDAKDKTDGWWLCRTELEHYRAYTAESGLKSGMLTDGGKRGLPTLEKMLDEYKPRMVTIECGIYDVEDGVTLEVYRKNMGKVLDTILDRGAIPVLNTIPPFKAQLDRTKQFNETLRELTKERGCPILDLEREIFTRRPDDWFGTLVDRIHLTAGQAGAEPTAENLRKSGYQLRGWLTVRKIAEIKRRVLDEQP